MRLILLLLIVMFPIAEIWTLITLAQTYGWWLLVYLVGIGYLGLQLIRQEKVLFSARMMQSFTQGGNPIKTMLGSARMMIAGILLMIPGLITDGIAVILLLMPSPKVSPHHTASNNQSGTFSADDFTTHSTSASNDDVIEGEFRRDDE